MARAFSTRKRSSLAVATLLISAVLVYFGWLAFRHLADIPGLHADEATFGLLGIEFMRSHVKTFHGMNSYTGSFYPWVVSLAFRLTGVSMETLRSVGATANLLALGILSWSLFRTKGWNSLIALILLLLASPWIIANARVAWEVTAFQCLMISLQISILLKAQHDQKISLGMGLAFMAISGLGVFNHFIFISNILGLTGAAICLYCSTSKGSRYHQLATQLVHLALATLYIAGVLFLLKPRLGDAERQLLVVLCFAIGISPAIYSLIMQSSESVCGIVIDAPGHFLHDLARKLKSWSARILPWRYGWIAVVMLGILALLVSTTGGASSSLERIYVHTWGLIGSLTSTLPLQRILSVRLSPAYLITSHIFWVLVVLTYMAAVIQEWKASLDHHGGDDTADLIFFLYPLFSYLALIPLAARSSERYYLISTYLFLCCFPAVINQVADYTFKPLANTGYAKTILFLAILLLLTEIMITQWTIIGACVLSPRVDTPFTIAYPGYNDTSFHFTDLQPLARYLKERGLCSNNVEANYFILAPLKFYDEVASTQNNCKSRSKVNIEYCESCREPIKNFRILLD